MIWDREIDRDPTPPRQAADRWAYRRACFGIGAALFVGTAVLAIVLMNRFRINNPAVHGMMPAFAGGVALLAAPRLADRCLRWRGLELPARPLAWTCTPLVPGGEPEADAVEAGIDPTLIRFLGIACGVGFVFFGGFPLAARRLGRPGSMPDTAAWFFVGFAALYGLAGVWMAILICWVGPTTRVDADGVRGYPTGPAVRRRFVPWSAVASAALDTWHDGRGRPRTLRPTLLGRHGERRLLCLDMGLHSAADQARIVAAIRARLPR